MISSVRSRSSADACDQRATPKPPQRLSVHLAVAGRLCALHPAADRAVALLQFLRLRPDRAGPRAALDRSGQLPRAVRRRPFLAVVAEHVLLRVDGATRGLAALAGAGVDAERAHP